MIERYDLHASKSKPLPTHWHVGVSVLTMQTEKIYVEPPKTILQL